MEYELRRVWMISRRVQGLLGVVLMGMAGVAGAAGPAAGNSAVAVNPAGMTRVGTVEERFQSFNIEMVEVTGGRFWAPYKQSGVETAADKAAKASVPEGIDPSLFRYRQPIDLGNPRLRKLAAALGPAYVRVSGTWANSTYFHDSDGPVPATPPTGFGSVLTRQEWKGVVDFSHAVDAKIVTSFAVSGGVRDADGVWTPVEAKKILAYTKSVGGSVAAAEMFNEPTLASIGGAPKGYDAAAYARDFKVFVPFVKAAAPEMLIVGPGGVGDAQSLGGPLAAHLIKSEDMLAAEGPGLDVFSYHYYGGVSKRCGRQGASHSSPETALTDAWLSKTNKDEEFYAALRDRFLPGKPLWLTETGETACGGDPWASTFIDSFRYLNQLGSLAKRGVQVVMHNTLAASDYALIDEATLTPRPNYWSALLWRKMMGTTVLDAGAGGNENLHVYAHCLRGRPGGVAMLVINADRTAAASLAVPVKSERYTLTAQDLMGGSVALNGVELKLGAGDALPKMAGKATAKGDVAFAPESITFLAIPGAGNGACK
jgi:heparanase 1